MSTIVTLTFNPALDMNTSVKEIVPERKLKCSDPLYEPGGGGINVARAIKKLGGDAIAVYFSGGDTGNKITALLQAERIRTRAVPIVDMTRQNLIILNQSSHGQYLFDMPGPLISAAELKACMDTLEQISAIEFLVVSGSLPKGVGPDVLFQLADLARRKHAKLVVDTAGEALQVAVKAGAYLIKPNLKELGFLTGQENITEENAGEAARGILRHSACEVIVVSMANKGALLITRSLDLKIKPPPVTVLSTVGAGDSLVGGLIFSLSNNKPLEEAIRYGVACGTSATISPGIELCRKEDADHLYSLIKDQI